MTRTSQACHWARAALTTTGAPSISRGLGPTRDREDSEPMAVLSGLSGNEMYCLARQGYLPGDLVVGNSVVSLGVVGSLSSAITVLAGGEVTQVTSLIAEGRHNSYDRLRDEAQQRGCAGITSVSSDLSLLNGNVEFLSVGSGLHTPEKQATSLFSTSADGQELYCQLDCGFEPKQFVLGNVAYSIGLGGTLLGGLRSLGRGEVKEYTEVFSTTRHLALERIKQEARAVGANAVVGIKTSIIPFMGMQEMLMLGTASHHPLLSEHAADPVTSDLTNQEMWNLASLGYLPRQLVLGVSVYSLGVVGTIASVLSSLGRGEVRELTTLVYEARHHALERVARDAQACGADEVVGIKTYVYQLGGGLLEFLAIGTAVKRVAGTRTLHEDLPAQAIIHDVDTFINTADLGRSLDLNRATKERSSRA